MPWDSGKQGAFVTALCTDRQNHVFTATEGRGVWRFDPTAITYTRASVIQPTWHLLDYNGGGECVDIVSFMKYPVQLLGIADPGDVVFLAPAPNHHIIEGGSYTRSCNVGQYGHTLSLGVIHHYESQSERLYYTDKGGQGGDQGGTIQQFEACYAYGDTLYPGGAGDSETFPDTDKGEVAIMSKVASQSNWVYLFKKQWLICSPRGISLDKGPGPDPEESW